MKKVVDFFKFPLFLPVAILAILYGYWIFFIPTITLFRYFYLNVGVISLSLYFIITILGRFSINHERFYLLPCIVAIPISFGGIFYSAILLFLMFTFDFYKHRPVLLSLLGIVAVAVFTCKKLVSQNQLQAIFFLITIPIFVLVVFNFVVYFPAIRAVAEFGGYKYYIVEEIYDYPHSDTHFMKCGKLNFQCENLSGVRFGGEIIVDEQKSEVSLFDSWGLNYTDGSNPRRYTGQEGEQLGNNLYYLSETCHNFNYEEYGGCEYYTFIPYECDLDSRSCDPLPIEITSDYESYYYWDADETQKKIRLLYGDDEILIFTYGDHPQCYVEGCKILEQK